MLHEYRHCLWCFSKEILELSTYCFKMLGIVLALCAVGKCSSKQGVLSHSSFFLTLRLICILKVLQNKLRRLLNLCWGKYCLKTFSEFSLYFVRAEDRFSILGISFPFSVLVISPSQLNGFLLSFKACLRLFHTILTVENYLSEGFASLLFLGVPTLGN